MLKTFLDALTERSGQTPLTFLDFGAGNAHISRTFKAALGDKVDIYCIEEMPECASLYSGHGLIYLTRIEDLPRQADLIYAIEVIEHVVNPVAVLKQLAGALASDGKIFVSTPAGHVQEKRTHAYDDASHLHFFTALSLNGALERAGLKPIEYRFFPEMYPLRAHQERRARAKALMPKLHVRLKGVLPTAPSSTSVSRDSDSSMGIPPSSDGHPYPYHLVGFTQSALASRLAGEE